MAAAASRQRLPRLCMILSPTKTMSFNCSGDNPALACTQPEFHAQAVDLVQQMRKLTKHKLKDLMKISDALAATNCARFAAFEDVSGVPACDVKPGTTPVNGNGWRQACLAFTGPAFQGLNAASLGAKDLLWAQGRLHVLCGLYGVLRPLDLIQPYRLEMGTKMAVGDSKSLCAFWQPQVTEYVQESLGDEPSVLVNLASKEYSSALDFSSLSPTVHVVAVVFKDDGRVKAVYAKRARGLMCRFIIQNRVTQLAELRRFNEEGYKFDAKNSDDKQLVFCRTGGMQRSMAKRPGAKAAKTVPKKRTRAASANVTGSGTGGATIAARSKRRRGREPAAESVANSSTGRSARASKPTASQPSVPTSRAVRARRRAALDTHMVP